MTPLIDCKMYCIDLDSYIGDYLKMIILKKSNYTQMVEDIDLRVVKMYCLVESSMIHSNT